MEGSMAFSDLKQHLQKLAQRIGFGSIGVSRAEALDSGRFQNWLDRGYQGEMSYMARGIEKRLDPRVLFPGTKSVISVTVDYGDPEPTSLGTDSTSSGQVSRYASGRDYHGVVGTDKG